MTKETHFYVEGRDAAVPFCELQSLHRQGLLQPTDYVWPVSEPGKRTMLSVVLQRMDLSSPEANIVGTTDP